MANRDYAGPPKAPRTPKVRVGGVVDQVVALVGALPVDRRLEAPHRTQRRVMDQVVEAQIDQHRS